MACLQRILRPIRVSLSSPPPSNPAASLTRNPVFGRFEQLKIQPERLEYILPTYAPRSNLLFSIQRNVLQNVNWSGRKLFARSFLGLSAAAGVIYHNSIIAYAMDDHHAHFGEPSGFLKDDLYNLWCLFKKFQLPIILLITVFFGWRRPLILAINVATLLFCTKPNPSSIYLFIEQLRQREMDQYHSLYKLKLFYVKSVDIRDYTFLCLGKVELRDLKLDVIGILGGWWVLPALQISEDTKGATMT